MPNCTGSSMGFGRQGRRVVEANFNGGAISSDGGLMLVRQVDRGIGLSAAAAAVLHDQRDPDRITHTLRDLVAQRLYIIGLARNPRLHAEVERWEARLAIRYARQKTKQRAIREFRYAAESWNIERRVITRLEYGDKGCNPRFLVTNLRRPAEQLYVVRPARGQSPDGPLPAVSGPW